jgi:hypothetical protein
MEERIARSTPLTKHRIMNEEDIDIAMVETVDTVDAQDIEGVIVLEEESPVVQIGKAASTIAGDQAAIKWANGWLNTNEGVESIAKLLPVHVEGENMRRILRSILNEFAMSRVQYARRNEGFLKAESKRVCEYTHPKSRRPLRISSRSIFSGKMTVGKSS